MYSPSVQFTLYDMGGKVLANVPEVRVCVRCVQRGWRVGPRARMAHGARARLPGASSEASGQGQGAPCLWRLPSVRAWSAHCRACATADGPQADHVFLNAPNLHFLPCTPVTSTFNHDVYIATSEPHGDIECVVKRKSGPQYIHSKL